MWLKALVALELIWTLAGGGVLLARSARPSAAAAIAFLRKQDVANLPAAARDKVMRDAADRLNRLSFEQMREVRESRALFAFYRPLDPLEKERFAAAIMPAGLRRILAASLDVPPDQRAQFLHKTLYFAVIDFSTANPPINPEALERIEREVVDDYARNLSAGERIQMAPQLQQLRKYFPPPAVAP